jgi:hypothetical protein
MPVGDINIKKFKIGNIDAKGNQVTLIGFNIYETLLNPLGPYGEVRFADAQDSIGKNNINGKEDVEIQFSADGVPGETVSFKFKLFQNPNNVDGTDEDHGSMHSKFYDFRFVSPEYLNAQGNMVAKTYNDQTSNIAKDIAKNFLKTKDDIEIKEQTKKERVPFDEGHPLKALSKLSNLYTGTKSKSGIFFLYKSRDGEKTKYIFDSPDNMFKSSPVVQLRQIINLSSDNTTENDRQNSISWLYVGEGFNAGTRSLSKPEEVSYNYASGSINRPKQKKQTPPVVADNPIYDNPPSDIKGTPVRTIYQPFNEKQKVDTASSRTSKQDYLSHFSQNYADIEVPGNPKIKLGTMIEIDIPRKADSGGESGERQFNGKALVVAIRHKVKPMGQTPRYTMILRIVKGSFKEGGGGNG